MPSILQTPVTLPNVSFATTSSNSTNNQLTDSNVPSSTTATTAMPMDLDDVTTSAGGDLENELREFLESAPGLHAATSSNSDDNSLVAQLLMN